MKTKAMLAHKYNSDKADYPAYIQPKLDGVRCLFSSFVIIISANSFICFFVIIILSINIRI